MEVIDLTQDSSDGEVESVEVKPSVWGRDKKHVAVSVSALRARRDRLMGTSIPRKTRAAPLLLPSTPSVVPAGVETSSRLPTPAPTVSRAPGMRPFQIDLLHLASDFSVGDLPFDVAELPTFDRKTWTRLATHRYQFQVAPKEDERAECSEALLSQLRYAFGISAFDSGLEPSIAYPTVAHTIHRFVDITFYSKEHHDRARNALLHWKTVKLTPWLHAAYVPHPWFPIQFTYPKEYVHNHADFFPKVHAALVRSDFGKMGKLVAAWVMPNGYPHSVDFIPQRGERDEQPQFVVVLKSKQAQRPQVRLPPYVNVEGTWVKVYWPDRPKLCDYCKAADDGHLNDQCTRRPRKTL